MTAKAELAGRLLESAELHTEKANQIDDAYYSSSELRAFADECREAAAALTEAGAGEAKPVAYADLDALAEMRRKHQPKEGRTAVSMVYPDAHDGFGKTRAALYASPPPVQPAVKAHPDNEAVDRFAAAMKSKLEYERVACNRYGWDDPDVCTVEYLADQLVKHIAKGNAGTFEDVANFAMMLHQRGADPQVLRAALTAPPSPAPGVTGERRARAHEAFWAQKRRGDEFSATKHCIDAALNAAIQPAEQPPHKCNCRDRDADGNCTCQPASSETDTLRQQLAEAQRQIGEAQILGVKTG